jgi:hypothetical protein
VQKHFHLVGYLRCRVPSRDNLRAINQQVTSTQHTCQLPHLHCSHPQPLAPRGPTALSHSVRIGTIWYATLHATMQQQAYVTNTTTHWDFPVCSCFIS